VGVEITVAGQGTLVKKGYSFTGWNTAADGSGKGYKNNATYTMGAENETFYAQWEINSYRIIYDGNGSDGGTVPEPTRHRYNSKVTIASETPARTGYTFYCWNTEKSGNGDDYRSENELTIGDKDLSLYARWTVNCYTISFDGNGGTAGDVPDSIDVNFDDSVIIP
jgi:uncharacterized repeat protein (TIGR02543 family)